VTRSELIDRLAAQQRHLSTEDVELAVKTLCAQMRDALVRAERIEIRGFGAFSLHDRQARMGRNPRTGEPVAVPAKRSVHFRPGKELRDRVNAQWTAGASDTAHPMSPL
jgi:integration host factor subunit beta